MIKMLDHTPDTLNLKELQKVLRIGKNTALKLLQDREIKGYRIGKKWLILKEDVIEYILVK